MPAEPLEMRLQLTLGKMMAATAVAALVGVSSPAAADEIEVTAPVENLSGTCPNLRFQVNGRWVLTDDGTEFDRGECADVQQGRLVEAEGKVRTDGVLIAREIDVKSPLRR